MDGEEADMTVDDSRQAQYEHPVTECSPPSTLSHDDAYNCTCGRTWRITQNGYYRVLRESEPEDINSGKIGSVEVVDMEYRVSGDGVTSIRKPDDQRRFCRVSVVQAPSSSGRAAVDFDFMQTVTEDDSNAVSSSAIHSTTISGLERLQDALLEAVDRRKDDDFTGEIHIGEVEVNADGYSSSFDGSLTNFDESVETATIDIASGPDGITLTSSTQIEQINGGVSMEAHITTAQAVAISSLLGEALDNAQIEQQASGFEQQQDTDEDASAGFADQLAGLIRHR